MITKPFSNKPINSEIFLETNTQKQAPSHSLQKQKQKHKQTQNKSKGRNIGGEAMSVLQYEKGEENQTTSEVVGGGDKA